MQDYRLEIDKNRLYLALNNFHFSIQILFNSKYSAKEPKIDSGFVTYKLLTKGKDGIQEDGLFIADCLLSESYVKGKVPDGMKFLDIIKSSEQQIVVLPNFYMHFGIADSVVILDETTILVSNTKYSLNDICLLIYNEFKSK